MLREKRKEKEVGFFHLMVIGILLVFPSLLPYASAEITIDWTFNGIPTSGTPITSGNVLEGDLVSVEIFDDESSFTEEIDIIQVNITSPLNPEGTILIVTETGAESQTFTGDNFVFLFDSSHKFLVSETVIVQVHGGPDDCTENLDQLDSTSSGTANGVTVYSDTSIDEEGDGVGLILDETGPDTCIFEGTVTFTESGSSDEDLGILLVSEGDILTFVDDLTDALTNAQIIPTINGKGSIVAEIGNTVTASYNMTDPADLDLTDDGAPGRGGGGPVRPGLVADSPSSSPNDSDNGSGCSGDCSPPTLGVDSSLKRIVEGGFSYNDNPVDVEHFYTPYPLVTVQVGEQNRAILKIYDDGGTQNIAHVELGFGLGKDESFSENRAAVILDISRDGRQSVTTFDPENVLDDVSVVTMKDHCASIVSSQCLIVIIDHTFREPLEFNMVGTQVWDFKRNSWQNFYNHGVHIIGDSLNPHKTKEVAFGTKEMRGLFTLTQTHKIEDKWIDEFGNVYQHKGNDRFDLIETIPKQVIEDFITMHSCDRNCNWFEKYKQNQEIIAHLKLQNILGGDITKDLPTFTPSPKISIVSRADDVVLQQSISLEIQRAEEIFANNWDVQQNFASFLPVDGMEGLNQPQNNNKFIGVD